MSPQCCLVLPNRWTDRRCWRGCGLLLLRSEGGGTLARPYLVQGLACDCHGGDESLLLSIRGNSGSPSRDHGVVLLPVGSGGMSRGRGIVLLPVGGGSGHGSHDSGLLVIDGEIRGAA
jgi:hypothetical protein